MNDVAVLYITHDRPLRTRLTLSHLLESSGIDDMSITIVANNASQATIEALCSFDHPSIERVAVFKDNNYPLAEITNWFWSNHLAWKFLGKVDDDTLIPAGFFFNARKVLATHPWMGAVSAIHWEANRLPAEEDYRHNILHSIGILWQKNVGGCCYLMPTDRVIEIGFIHSPGYFKGGWSEYQWALNARGHLCGYLYPLQFAKHLQNANIYHRILSSVGPFSYDRAKEADEIKFMLFEAKSMLTEQHLYQVCQVNDIGVQGLLYPNMGWECQISEL